MHSPSRPRSAAGTPPILAFTVEISTALSALLIHDAVDGAEQSAHRHLEPRTGVGRMWARFSVTAEHRADIGDAGPQIALGGLQDVDVDLVAGMDLYRVFGAERVFLDRGAPDGIRGRRHLHR